MSTGLYSITTRASGTILTAAIYNADHQNHVTNQNPSMTGAYSDNVTQMQLQSNPGGVGTEVLAGSLGVELEYLRFKIAQIIGTTFWYDVVPESLTAIVAASTAQSTGDVKPTLKSSADAGWVMLNDGTIGDGSSGASNRANADTSALFTLLWNSIQDAFCPVSGGRGGAAATDFSAHKKITLPRFLGRALSGAGTGSGLSARALGGFVGEETHQLIVGEMPSHSHALIPSPVIQGGTGGPSLASDGVTTQSAGVTGGDGVHNNMQPTIFINFMIKL